MQRLIIHSSLRCHSYRLLKGVAVVFDQVAAREAGSELLDDFLYLIVFQPWVDDLELLAQDRKYHHLGKILAVAVGWLLLAVEADYVPAQSVKLIEQGFFDVVAFVNSQV